MEGSLWGTSYFLPSTSQYLVFELLTETSGTCAQEDRLWVADPKAINHILQKSGYLYEKSSNIREQVALVAGRTSILATEGELLITMHQRSVLSSPNDPKGDTHKRHRRVIAPAFGLVEAKSLVPHFMDVVTKARNLRIRSRARRLTSSPSSDGRHVE